MTRASHTWCIATARSPRRRSGTPRSKRSRVNPRASPHAAAATRVGPAGRPAAASSNASSNASRAAPRFDGFARVRGVGGERTRRRAVRRRNDRRRFTPRDDVPRGVVRALEHLDPPHGAAPHEHAPVDHLLVRDDDALDAVVGERHALTEPEIAAPPRVRRLRGIDRAREVRTRRARGFRLRVARESVREGSVAAPLAARAVLLLGGYRAHHAELARGLQHASHHHLVPLLEHVQGELLPRGHRVQDEEREVERPVGARRERRRREGLGLRLRLRERLGEEPLRELGEDGVHGPRVRTVVIQRRAARRAARGLPRPSHPPRKHRARHAVPARRGDGIHEDFAADGTRQRLEEVIAGHRARTAARRVPAQLRGVHGDRAGHAGRAPHRGRWRVRGSEAARRSPIAERPVNTRAERGNGGREGGRGGEGGGRRTRKSDAPHAVRRRSAGVKPPERAPPSGEPRRPRRENEKSDTKTAEAARRGHAADAVARAGGPSADGWAEKIVQLDFLWVPSPYAFSRATASARAHAHGPDRARVTHARRSPLSPVSAGLDALPGTP